MESVGLHFHVYVIKQRKGHTKNMSRDGRWALEYVYCYWTSSLYSYEQLKATSSKYHHS